MSIGPESRGVIDLLLTLRNARFIRGNHDDVLDQVLHGTAYAQMRRMEMLPGDAMVSRHGLLETLQSYGVTIQMIGRVMYERNEAAIQPIIDLFRRRIGIHTFAAVFLEDDDLFLIHGKCPSNKSTARANARGESARASLRQETCGRFTDDDLLRPQKWTKRGFFGHTPCRRTRDMTSLRADHSGQADADGHGRGALPIGRLSAICVETSRLVQAEPLGKLVVASHSKSQAPNPNKSKSRNDQMTKTRILEH